LITTPNRESGRGGGGVVGVGEGEVVRVGYGQRSQIGSGDVPRDDLVGSYGLRGEEGF